MQRKKNDLKKRFVSTNINEKSLNLNVKENEEFDASLKILDKFERFKKIKDLKLKALVSKKNYDKSFI